MKIITLTESDWISFIKKRLEEPLPGVKAQVLMSPLSYHDKRFNTQDKKNARKGAVLILLNGGQIIPLIKRSLYDGPHSGQMALPGGKIEAGEGPIEAAVRETEEEIGIAIKEIEILGALSPLYIPPSGYLVHPFVGYTSRKFFYNPDPSEVAEVHEVSVTDLLNDDLIKKKRMKLPNNMIIDTPYLAYGDQVVWGATAMMLSEFRYLLKEKAGE